LDQLVAQIRRYRERCRFAPMAPASRPA
jgi:hypothetical protein